MKALKQILAVGGLVLAMTGTGFAVGINGSLPFLNVGISQDTGLISTSTIFDAVLSVSDTPGGDFVVVPSGTPYGDPGPLFALHLDLSNLASFTLVSAAFGSFQASSGFVVEQGCTDTDPGEESCALDVYLIGIYSGLPGFDDSSSSLRLGVSQGPRSLAMSAVLTAPALDTPVPEPATMFLMGSALVGLAAMKFRRKA